MDFHGEIKKINQSHEHVVLHMVRAAQFYCDIQKQAGAEQSMQPQHRDPFVCPVLEESQLGGTGK